MSDYLLADRAEEAFVALLTEPVRTALSIAVDAPVPVYPGKNQQTKSINRVICEAEVGDEVTLYTGNFWVDATITIQFTATTQPGQVVDTKEKAETLQSAVNNALLVDDLESQLTAAAAQFHVFAGSVKRLASGPREYDAVESAWVDKLRFRFMACASDLT